MGVLNFIGPRKYLVADRFGVLPMKGDVYRISTMELIKLTSHGTFNQREYSWRLLRKLKLMTAMDLPFTSEAGEVLYTLRLDKLN